MGETLTSTFVNSKDPDEMQHDASFHQGLHCYKGKKNLQTKEYIFSSPEPKALSELIGWDSSRRPCVRVSVHTFRHEYL